MFIPTIYGDDWGMVCYCYTHIIRPKHSHCPQQTQPGAAANDLRMESPRFPVVRWLRFNRGMSRSWKLSCDPMDFLEVGFKVFQAFRTHVFEAMFSERNGAIGFER